MAITSMSALNTALLGVKRQTIYKVTSSGKAASTFQSLLKVGNRPPAATSSPATGSGAIPTASEPSAFWLPTPSGSNKSYIGSISISSTISGSLIIYDRLWHNSGMSGISTSSQTINSTTLTRSTDGLGVEIWLEVYTAMGATASTFSVVYTDASNTSVTGTYVMAASALAVGQMVQITPPNDSSGVKSIQSVILSASTGTVGDFGLVLMKRIVDIPISIASVPAVFDTVSLGLQEIPSSASLHMMAFLTGTPTGTYMGYMDIIEG